MTANVKHNSAVFKPLTVLLLVVIWNFSLPAFSQFYNGSQLTFGKSRVQYNDFLWTYFRFDKFDTYFYQNGKELAQFTAEYADKNIKEIELNLQSNLEEKIQFIIFNNLSDLKQSNIGLYSDWEYYNTGGVTRIIGGRVLVFFDGHYEHFEQQIRAGIAQVILNNMMYGKGIGAQIKNNAIYTMPEWYMNGLISYLSRKWDPEIENHVRDAIRSGQYRKFNSLSGEDATYAGHSFWHYIAAKFGAASIPNIVYMSRLSRNVEKGFQYAVGASFKAVAEEWLGFYQDLYSLQEAGRTLPSGKLLNPRKKPDRVFNQIKLNPEGSKAAYCTHELGIHKVFLQDIETGKKKWIYRGGYRLADRPDESFPILAWHPSGKILAILTERKGDCYLYLYNIEDKSSERQILYNFDKILDISYSGDGSLLVFSAVQKGQSDIFVYNIASGSHEQITRDIYDDLNPRFYNYSSDIIFSSNRTNDTLRYNEMIAPEKLQFNHDIFLYHYSSKKNVLQRLTLTPEINEAQPMAYGEGYFTFLGDESGIVNRYLARFDSAISFVDTTTHYRYFTSAFPVTNYSRNILEQDVSMKGAKIAEIVLMNRNYRVFSGDLIRPGQVEKTTPKPIWFKEQKSKVSEKIAVEQSADSIRLIESIKSLKKQRFTSVRVSEVIREKQQRGDTLSLPVRITDLGRIPMQGDSGWKAVQMAGSKVKDTLNKYKSAKQLNYNVEYYIDQMVTQIDFTYLNFAYQPFTGSSIPVFINPGLNGLFMVGITDLMEDYRITGGVRVNFNLINNEYLFSYSNNRRRLDHQITFHRKAVEEYGYYSIIRHKIHELYYVATYPFTPVLNIKGTASVRWDRAVYLSTDQINLAEPDVNQVWGSIKGELTYDNTRNLGLNLYKGTRYKIFGEYYQMVNAKANHCIVLGFDFRNYQRVHRTLVWANRLAASTSFGSDRLLYYMGGVDNWLFPSFNIDTPVSLDQNYAFQTLATNMRGFNQNIRNGSSFVVFNTELRWPVFRYFYNRPIRSDFLNNFQIVGFGDIGTAWNGISPWSSDNPLFTRYIYRNPLFIKVEMQKDPLVEGFGVGARTRLFGYFLRADVAWGVEDGRVRKPVFYFSLSLDF